MTDARCQKCGMVFKSGTAYGYACPYAPHCGPVETEGMVAPFGGPWLDPMPRQDLTLPPPAGYVTRADYDALAARLAEVERDAASIEILAKWAHCFVSADRWKGRNRDAAPPEDWDNLREETRQWWRDEAAAILTRIDHPKGEA